MTLNVCQSIWYALTLHTNLTWTRTLLTHIHMHTYTLSMQTHTCAHPFILRVLACTRTICVRMCCVYVWSDKSEDWRIHGDRIDHTKLEEHQHSISAVRTYRKKKKITYNTATFGDFSILNIVCVHSIENLSFSLNQSIAVSSSTYIWIRNVNNNCLWVLQLCYLIDYFCFCCLCIIESSLVLYSIVSIVGLVICAWNLCDMWSRRLWLNFTRTENAVAIPLITSTTTTTATTKDIRHNFLVSSLPHTICHFSFGILVRVLHQWFSAPKPNPYIIDIPTRQANTHRE